MRTQWVIHPHIHMYTQYFPPHMCQRDLSLPQPKRPREVG